MCWDKVHIVFPVAGSADSGEQVQHGIEPASDAPAIEVAGGNAQVATILAELFN